MSISIRGMVGHAGAHTPEPTTLLRTSRGPSALEPDFECLVMRHDEDEWFDSILPLCPPHRSTIDA